MAKKQVSAGNEAKPPTGGGGRRRTANKLAVKSNAGVISERVAFRDVDETDQKIIELLREDGRITVRMLAEQVGLSEASIRARMRALEETQAIRVTATVNIKKLGQHFSAPIGISVKDRNVDDVAADLAKIPEVVTVLTMIGPPEIELQVVTLSLGELERVLLQSIPAVSGVAKVERALALDPTKYDQLWMPFR